MNNKIKEAIIRYFMAVEVVDQSMLIEYACECAGLPFDPVRVKDKELVKKHILNLKKSGIIEYKYIGGGKYESR